MLNNISDKKVKQMSRLKPLNKSSKNQKVFQSMAFIIFCTKHRKIAVSDNIEERRELAVWFPSVYLSSDIKTRITIEESVGLIMSDGNRELTALYKKEQPFDSNITHIVSQSIQLFNFGFTPSVCLVRLHSDNPGLQCCRKTSRIIWLDIEQISDNYFDCFWGPHLNYYRHFDEVFQKLRYSQWMFTTIRPDILEPPTDCDLKVLNSLQITINQMKLFYFDFIEHTFPSVMSILSFKDYLEKYGFKTSEKSMKRLYNAFMENPRDYIYVEELLLALALIDPKSEFNCTRIAFLFRYYDFDRDGYLNKEEFRGMVEDIHRNETSDMIDTIVNDYWFILIPSDRGIDKTQFFECVKNRTIIVSNHLCRHEFRILLKIISTLETRNRGIVSRFKTFVSHYCSKILKK